MMGLGKKRAIKKIKTLMYTGKVNADIFRLAIEKKFTSAFLSSKVECRTTIINGIKADLLTPEVSAKKRVIMYLCGGSFVGSSRLAWRSFCCSLSNESSTRVIVPEIRIPPSDPYPAGLEDALVVLNKMLEHDDEIFVVADSSGCSIALAAILSLNSIQVKKIKGIIFFSPWLNISNSSNIFTEKLTDGVLTGDVIKTAALAYTHVTNLENPFVSPALHEPSCFEDLPPFFIQAGSLEPQLKDIHNFAQLLESKKVSCTIDIWDDMFHLFQLADELPEAQKAVEKVGYFIKDIEKTEISQWN
ncbi:MAG: alpha/beta hydrolase [Treponemataceae bacterium]